jgi:hypothetical protein
MKTAEIISEQLNSGINPKVEVTVGYFENTNSVTMKNSKHIGYLYEFDSTTNYCRVDIDGWKLVTHLSSIKLI